MNPIAPFIEKQGVVILDGALATELEKRGADLNHELWSAKLLLEDPGAISKLHYDYFVAGADVAITASYQASLEGFEKLGRGRHEAGRLIQASVTVALEARDQFESVKGGTANRLKPLVAASIGPYGAILADGSEYTGNYDLSREELKDFHRPRMALLDDTGADFFALETIPSQLEAEALLELLEEFPARKAWLSFSCRDGKRLCHGEPFADCARQSAERDQILAVGVNCTAPEHVLPLLRSVADQSVAGRNKPMLAYPNSGEVYEAADNSWLTPESNEGHAPQESFTDLALQWRDAGARLIGGCCRTSVEDISALRRNLLETPG